MTAYTSPLADMRFVIRQIADLNAVRELPGYEEATDDLVDAILEEAARLGEKVLAPLNASGDRQGCVFENGAVRVPDGFVYAYQQFVAGGWNGLALPSAYGGQGLPCLLATAVGEIWNAANLAFATCPILTQAAAELLLHHGDARMRADYLPKLVLGEWTGTMQLTEAQAGSDLARVRTRAIPEGDHYRIFGQKIFITYGEHDLAPNIIHAVLARTPNAPEGVKGLSLFLVPKFLVKEDGRLGPRNDLRCVSIEHKMGINASPTAVMSLGDDSGAIGFLIGEENRGLNLMFTMMNNARLAVGLEGVGIADRAYQQARSYAFERVQGRQLGDYDPEAVAIVRHPDVQRMLLTMKSQTEAARALAYFTAAALDAARRHPDDQTRRRHQRLVDLLTPVVKAWCTGVGIDVADTGIQVHGGIGYIEESGVPQFLRDARGAAIYEGTNGIQAMDLVSRKVAGDGGVTVRELIDVIVSSVSRPATVGSADVQAVRGHLARAAADLTSATNWLIDTYPLNPSRVAAGAVFYLRLLGDVVGGWLMATAATQAAVQVEDGSDRTFLSAKLKSARYFADIRLAESGALRRKFFASGKGLQGFEPDIHL
jgi:alkylation response protein AidB-like acyl-CoA dehydrogenase